MYTIGIERKKDILQFICDVMPDLDEANIENLSGERIESKIFHRSMHNYIYSRVDQDNYVWMYAYQQQPFVPLTSSKILDKINETQEKIIESIQLIQSIRDKLIDRKFRSKEATKLAIELIELTNVN